MLSKDTLRDTEERGETEGRVWERQASNLGNDAILLLYVGSSVFEIGNRMSLTHDYFEGLRWISPGRPKERPGVELFLESCPGGQPFLPLRETLGGKQKI